MKAYAYTKRAQVVLTDQWAKQLAGVESTCTRCTRVGEHARPAEQPAGFAKRTGRILRTPGQGADTIVWLAAAEEPGRTTGGFWHDRRRRPEHRLPRTGERPGDPEALVALCERLTAKA